MNIGVFVGSYSPDIGGAYTFEQEICRAIETLGPASGHKFVLFTHSRNISSAASTGGAIEYVSITDDGRRSRFSKWCHRAVCFANTVVSPWAAIDSLDRMADPVSAHIREKSIDLTWSLFPACLSTKVPFITTAWDLQHRIQPYFPEVSLIDEWDGREKGYSVLLRKATFIFTGTETGKLEIEKFYQVPGERIKILPLPTPQFITTDSHGDEDILLRKYGLPETYLLYPAQFWPHKNHYGLLMGLQSLHEKFNQSLPVVFVGSDKGNLAYINRVVSDLGLTNQVHFLGFVPRDHLVALYRNAFALLFLSFFGPDNLPPLEAFALGCPVIASNVSGSEEQLGDAALLVDPKDPIDIAAAINLLLNDASLRQTLMNRGLERASRWTGASYFKSACSIFDEFENIRRTWSNSELFQLVR